MKDVRFQLFPSLWLYCWSLINANDINKFLLFLFLFFLFFFFFRKKRYTIYTVQCTCECSANGLKDDALFLKVSFSQHVSACYIVISLEIALAINPSDWQFPIQLLCYFCFPSSLLLKWNMARTRPVFQPNSDFMNNQYQIKYQKRQSTEQRYRI